MCFGHDNAGPFLSCIKEKKIKSSHATTMKKDHACVSIKSKKQSYVQMKLYRRQDISYVLHISVLQLILRSCISNPPWKMVMYKYTKSCIQHNRHVSCAKVVSTVYILTKLPNKTKGCAGYVLVGTLAFHNSLTEIWWLNQATCMKINRVAKLMLHANGPAYRRLCSVNK